MTAEPTPDFCWTIGRKLQTLAQIVWRLGSEEGDWKYNETWDLDHDGDIDWRDIEIVLVDIPTCRHGRR